MRSSKNSSKISGTRPTPSLNPAMKYNDILRIERKALFVWSLGKLLEIYMQELGFTDFLYLYAS